MSVCLFVGVVVVVVVGGERVGGRYVTCFTVGDQLLWGAAEPVRRMLEILLQHLKNRA